MPQSTTVPFIFRNISSQSYWPIRTSCLHETPSRFSFACLMALLCALESHPFRPPLSSKPRLSSSSLSLLVSCRVLVAFRVQKIHETIDSNRSRSFREFRRNSGSNGRRNIRTELQRVYCAVNIESKCYGTRFEIGFKYAAGARTRSRIWAW